MLKYLALAFGWLWSLRLVSVRRLDGILHETALRRHDDNLDFGYLKAWLGEVDKRGLVLVDMVTSIANSNQSRDQKIADLAKDVSIIDSTQTIRLDQMANLGRCVADEKKRATDLEAKVSAVDWRLNDHMRAMKKRLDELASASPAAYVTPPTTADLAIRLVSDRYGPFTILHTAAGPSGPIFGTKEGFGQWELDGKPRLTGRRVPGCELDTVESATAYADSQK